MKQIFLLTLTLFILLLSACSSETSMTDVSSNTETEMVQSVSSEPSDSTLTQPDKTNNTEIKTEQTDVSVVSSTSQATESTAKNTEKVTESSVPTTVESKETTTKVQPKSTSATFITESTIDEEPIIKATSSDCSIIADKVIEYINAFRTEEGAGSAVKLSGLTEYAEYRSWQLVTNFAHDTIDERAAATALKYGEYIEPSLYGMTGKPYYTANAREAIAKTSFGGTVDAVAKYIARMAKNSSGHWNYVGDKKYQYIAVGITCESGNWYCCIAMSRENTDNK